MVDGHKDGPPKEPKDWNPLTMASDLPGWKNRHFKSGWDRNMASDPEPLSKNEHAKSDPKDMPGISSTVLPAEDLMHRTKDGTEGRAVIRSPRTLEETEAERAQLSKKLFEREDQIREHLKMLNKDLIGEHYEWPIVDGLKCPGRMEYKNDTGVVTEDGKVTKLIYADDTVRSAEYDGSRIRSYALDDRVGYKTHDGLHWNSIDPLTKGERKGTMCGVMNLSKDGSVTFVNLKPKAGEHPHVTMYDVDGNKCTDKQTISDGLKRMMEQEFKDLPQDKKSHKVSVEDLDKIVHDKYKRGEERLVAAYLSIFLKQNNSHTAQLKDIGKAVNACDLKKIAKLLV